MTPTMIEAGLPVLSGYDPGWVDDTDFLAKLFDAMLAAAPTSIRRIAD